MQSTTSESSQVISRNEFVKSHSYSRSRGTARVDIKGIALRRSGERNEDVDIHAGSTHGRVREWLLASLFLSFFFYLSHVATRAGYGGQLSRAHRLIPRPSCVIQGVFWTEERKEDKRHRRNIGRRATCWRKNPVSSRQDEIAMRFIFIFDNREVYILYFMVIERGIFSENTI